MRYLAYFLLLCAFFSCQNSYQEFKQLEGEKAMLVSAHPIASLAGKKVLKAGGNAIDAAVAVHFMLAVVYPEAGNIGGGGFMIFRPAQGPVQSLDFRETAPALAYRDMYLDSLGQANDSLSRLGALSVGVPGSVAGLFEAHQKYGKLPWAKLIAPAIEVAEKGYILSASAAKRLNEKLPEMRKVNRYQMPFMQKESWAAGDRIVQKELAQTLKRIQKEGRDGFYKGETAALFLAEMQAAGGLIQAEDLDNYQPKWRSPIQFNYKNKYTVYSMPPPSSGGIALAQLLQMVEDYPLKQMGFQSTRAVHLMVEAERRVYSDRAKHLGDTDFYPVPMEALTDKAYAKNRMRSFSYQKASPSQEIQAGQPKKVAEETTHYSIVDEAGNAVSITTTLNGNFGSKLMVQGAGFFLNNEMDDFSAKPGHPNMFGLLGSQANAIAPKKRMLSSMTPTIVDKDGELFMVLGSPGGSTIITSVFQVLLNVIEFEQDLPSAVQAPRFHHQWLPDQIYIEEGAIPESEQQQLKKMGHQFKLREPIGRVDAIIRLPNGKWQGAADQRGNDSAAGY